MEAPLIETARLTLRAHRATDLDACAAMWADPIVTRHIGGVPSNRQRSWARILGYVGHWDFQRYGYWAIEEKATGEYVGEAGFADYKRVMNPSIEGIPELGWALIPRVHGRGFATEALRAIAAWGDANLSVPRVVCIINPQNTASIRVAEKLEFRQISCADYDGSTVLLFERTCQIPAT